MEIYSKTDIGLKRSSNQDAYITGKLDKDVYFAIVCDGMGGAAAGNIASRVAVEKISDYIIRSYRIGQDSYETEKILKNAITSVNMQIYDMAIRQEELSGMGTTVVAVIVMGNTAVIAHVGDSRVYKINKEMIQLTKDHSVVQTLLETGEITEEDAKTHPKKNVITRALGVEENVIVDSMQLEIEQDDILLMCTDGLTSYSDENDILKLIEKSERESAVDKLIELAKNGGGGDNITIVLLYR